jgi:pyridoxine 5-phosphate synthase
MNPLVTTGLDARGDGTALSVNVNKIALLRNQRPLPIPSVVGLSRIALEAGAHGITVHPRPDERHIRRHDVFELAAMLKDWPRAEFNIEGNPFHNLMELVRETGRSSAPSCPTAPSRPPPTTAGTWPRRRAAEAADRRGARARRRGQPVHGRRAAAMAAARAVGADRVELYTEPYAQGPRHGRAGGVARRLRRRRAGRSAEGLGVNAGHDLNLANLGDFVAAVPGVLEVSIGHAFVADALELGMAATVRAYVAALARSLPR